MAYNPKYNEQSYEYRKTHLKRVGLDFPLQYYEKVLMPIVERSGMTLSGYIKEAITEKMDRDGFFMNPPET